MKKSYKKGSNVSYYKLATAIFILISMLTVSFQSAIAKSSGNAGQIHEKHVPGQVIVKFKDGAGLDAGFLKGYDALSAKKISKADKTGNKASKSFKKFGIDRMYMASFSESADLAKLIKKLNKDSKVEYAELNYIYHATLTPEDPDLDQLWGLHNTGQSGGTADADIDAPEAWDIQTGSSDVVIAVIDTGVDYTHPDLAANIWTNELELSGTVGYDDDGNGFVDDIYGWDFANGDNNPFDDQGHGTHCAGTIGAVGNDGVGVVGVNWNVSIMPVKFLNSGGSGSTVNAILSIEYATMMGVDVMSNSWGGGGYSQALEDAILAASKEGILFVAAAGNNGTNNDMSPHYPSSYDVPNVIAVAATDRNDNMASFSCYGATSVDLGAPGVNIYSTVPTGLCKLCNSTGYNYLSGTSMATPHVAGAAGLIKAQYPLLTSDEIKVKLLERVDPIPALQSKTVTGGRLNVYNSLEEDFVAPNIVTDLATTDATYNSVTLSWTAVGDDGDTGTANSYDVRYSTSEITEANLDSATKANGEPNPQIASSTETFEVTGLEFDTTYYFALKVIDNVGNISGLSNIVSEVTTSPVIVFYDDMESGTNGWVHSGVSDNWELGAPISGPGYSYSGSNAWATDLDNDYRTNDMNAWLSSPSINLNGVESAQLTFQHYYYTENYYDGAIVEISVDDGVSWTQMTPNGGYPEDALYSGNPLGSVPAYSGYSGDGWHQAIFDISNYDGYGNVNIRFRFGTDYSVNGYPGWYIDDVVIYGQSNGENISPVANAGADQTVSDADGSTFETITLDGSESYDPDGDIASYAWFINAEPSPICTDAVFTHDFPIGISTVTLVIEDDDGATSTDKAFVFVNPNQPPTADVGPDQTSVEGATVNFDGSGSNDPDGNIASYSWDFGDGATESGISASHSYATAGTYTVTLTVTDNGGAVAIDTLAVTVNTEPLLETIYIESLGMITTKIKIRGWYTYAAASMTIVDTYGISVEGATVFGDWSELTSDFVFGTTNGLGQVEFNSENVKNAEGTFTFTVTGIEKEGVTYDISGEQTISETVSK